MNCYKTISENIQFEIEPIKKSRFITHVFYIENEQEALDSIATIKEKYNDANHHCWAYALVEDNKSRFSDDGEPSGSAGKPILAHIQGSGLLNILVVVVRYFGGVKLGVGGLIRAYGQAAKEALNIVDTIDIKPSCRIRIKHEYSETANTDIVLRHYNAEVLSQQYSDAVVLMVKISSTDKLCFLEELNNVTKGKAKVEIID
ncbi:YigZ family protein [Francisella sp. LA112445]|uniref:YigZ family protein n=1 Tax=Francisella sp. LA112445 TaxID=1395624 RepID=UPI001788AD49|nr:YigZ family protein [Francisella sp. LA112445]QIW09582.1 YigZ family protein [Francisella sp. LA112445]